MQKSTSPLLPQVASFSCSLLDTKLLKNKWSQKFKSHKPLHEGRFHLQTVNLEVPQGGFIQEDITN